MAAAPGAGGRDGPAPTPAGWTRARGAALAFIAVWLAIQVTLPAAGLLADPPVRFAWQMYSGVSDHPSYVLVYDDGEEEPETLRSLLAWTRADLAYHHHLPQHLCRTEDGLFEVRVVPGDGDAPPSTVPCAAVGRDGP